MVSSCSDPVIQKKRRLGIFMTYDIFCYSTLVMFYHMWLISSNFDVKSIIFSQFLPEAFPQGTVSGSGTGPLDYGATGPVPDP